MPINHAIWTVGLNPTPLPAGRLPSEQLLEDMIQQKPAILSDNWMFIGRQEITPFGGRVDLLAIEPDGSLVLIELKRDKTPRQIVAQAIDYASWVETLTSDKIAIVYQRFSNGGNLDDDFKQRFGTELDEESLNSAHKIIIVAAELDDAAERIIQYLNERDIAINVALFRVFQHGEAQFLSRAWFIDPGETQVNAATNSSGERAKEPWNGEFYVSFGGDFRSWEDARKFGFISAGGGGWYSQTLKLLSPGDRIWVKIPKKGYVGVGTVLESVQSSEEFQVDFDGAPRSVYDALKFGAKYRERAEHEPENAEHFIRVRWSDTLPEEQAFNEVGLFGNQNTVCQPTSPKWRHTLERLQTVFKRRANNAD